MYYGIICGSATGAFIFLFKFLAKKAEEVSHFIYSVAKTSPLYLVLVFVGLAVFALAMSFLHRKVPAVKGGGIPRSEGVLRGILSFDWLKTLVGTFVGSMFSFLCGLPLGSEGPAVLMGTSLGAMCGKMSKNRSTWSRYVMTGGAGAGFAVATGAPLSGILFALEEIHKRFTPMLVLTVSFSVVSATYVNQLLCQLFGINPNLFEIEAFGIIELSHVGYLLLLGVLIALAVGLFDWSIDFVSKICKKYKKILTSPIKLLCVFLLTGVFALCFSEGIYSGHHLILEVAETGKTFGVLFAILAVRLLMMLLVTGSGATGGIFIPTLAIGATAGALIAKLLVLIGLPNELFPFFVFLGMCAFIGGTLRAPLTAAVLFVEFTGQFTNLFFVALVIFTVTFITEIFNQVPFYDLTLENMEHEQNEGREAKISCFEMKVSENAFVVGKTVRDIMWPSSSVVIGIKRAEEKKDDMDNDGEKKLFVGDTVILRARYFDEEELKNLLFGLVGKEFEIHKTEIK
jgi:H+/Cl- antiporter ClcA